MKRSFMYIVFVMLLSAMLLPGIAEAESCRLSAADIVALLEDADDEQLEEQVASQLGNVPHACLAPLLVDAMEVDPWRALVAVNVLGLRDDRVVDAILDVLVHSPPDGGFEDLVEALIIQSRGNAKAVARLGALASSTRSREQGLPRATAIDVLGRLAPLCYRSLARAAA